MFSFAIDFDEVLADSMTYALQEYNTMYPIETLTRDHIVSFDWENLTECVFTTREESVLFWREILARQNLDDLLPVEGAVAWLRQLSQMWHQIHIITARHHSNYDNIKLWCEQRFWKIFTSYHTLWKDDPLHRFSKGIYAKNLGITHALDDGWHNIEEYFKHDIQAYCLNTPWNKNHSLDPSIRVDSWDEFIVKIHHEMNIWKYS